jgi:hypothetical protein
MESLGIPKEKFEILKEEMEILDKRAVRKPFVELEPDIYSYSTKPSFQPPIYARPSNLASNSQQGFTIDPPRINDPFFNHVITTVGDSDQAGVRSMFNMSSDTWTLTPSGEAEPLVAPASAIVEETVFPEEALPPEEEEEAPPLTIEREAVIPPIPRTTESTPVKKEKQPAKLTAPSTLPEVSYTKSLKASLPMIATVNDAIQNGFSIKNIPPEVLASKGPTRGFVKKDATSFLLAPVYEEVLKWNATKK